MRYIFSVMVNDPSRTVRRHVARSVVESLALLAIIGEIKTASKDTEALLIEEDGTAVDKTKEVKKSEHELVVRALRKDKEVGKSDPLRECIMAVILCVILTLPCISLEYSNYARDPHVDHEVRWCLLKLADLLVKGKEETLPKVTIHLPPTPVSEMPPTLPAPIAPTVRIVPKTKTSLKLGNRKGSIVTQAPALPPPTKLRVPTPQVVAPVSAPASVPPVAVVPNGKRMGTVATPKPIQASNLKKKDKPVIKAQSSGMSANDLKACRSALKKLMDYKHSLLFRQPVDPVRDKAPKYVHGLVAILFRT